MDNTADVEETFSTSNSRITAPNYCTCISYIIMCISVIFIIMYVNYFLLLSYRQYITIYGGATHVGMRRSYTCGRGCLPVIINNYYFCRLSFTEKYVRIQYTGNITLVDLGNTHVSSDVFEDSGTIRRSRGDANGKDHGQ